MGNVMLQKTYVHNVLIGKQRKNNCQIAKYYVEHTHEGIISKELFDTVNQLLCTTLVYYGAKGCKINYYKHRAS